MADEPWDMTVGVIVGAHGIRGELRVRPETDQPERFADLEEVRLVGPEGEARPARVLASKPHRQGLLVRLAEVTDRTQAEGLWGYAINIRRSMALPLGPDEYYIDQIVGRPLGTRFSQLSLEPLRGRVADAGIPPFAHRQTFPRNSWISGTPPW